MQYGETDLSFCHRILEEAGIAYTIPASPDHDPAVLLSDRLHRGDVHEPPLRHHDSLSRHSDEQVATLVRLAAETRPGAVALRDFDLRRPAFSLLATAEREQASERRLEQFHYFPGGFLGDTGKPENTPVADGEGASRHDLEIGRQRASNELDAERGARRVVDLHTNLVGLEPGAVFAIAGHPHPMLSDAARLVARDLELEGHPLEPWRVHVRAVFADVPVRPALQSPRPRAHVQSATVVGNGEIDPDELGRVLVRFPWDRDGEPGVPGSVWVRVNQAWAGAGYGMLTLPRVGEEVLIDFLEGNPEQPVVVGRVFNRTEPVPYELPKNDTKSGWKSDSSADAVGFNELMLEDAKGAELVHQQAECDRRSLVKNDQTFTIRAQRTKEVEDEENEKTVLDRAQITHMRRVELSRSSRTIAVLGERRDRDCRDLVEHLEGERVVTVGKDAHLVVERTARERIESNEHVTIGGTRQERVGHKDSLMVGAQLGESVGDYSVNAGVRDKGVIHLAAGSAMQMEAGVEVLLKSGGNFIDIGTAGITIEGTPVLINEGGSGPESAGLDVAEPEPPREAEVREPEPPPIDFEASVEIRDESGFGKPCPLIPAGKSHRYRAVGLPGGGSYRWSVSGSVGIKGSSDQEVVEVEGKGVSGEMGDSHVAVEYTVDGETGQAKLDLTVFSIKDIEVKLRSTPRRRDGTHADQRSFLSVNDRERSFDKNPGIVVVRGCGRLQLSAVTTPRGVPVVWSVERAEDESLYDLPTHMAEGQEHFEVETDATGSFHVTPHANCPALIDGNGPLVNLTMVEVVILSGQPWRTEVGAGGRWEGSFEDVSLMIHDSVKERPCLSVSTGDDKVVNDGQDDGERTLRASAFWATVTIRLRGGGPAGMRGVQGDHKVNVGFNQIATRDTFGGAYSGGARVREVVPLSDGGYEEENKDLVVFTDGDPPLAGFPVKDLSSPMKGGDHGVYGFSDAPGNVVIRNRVLHNGSNSSPGQVRQVWTRDSPSVVLPLAHPKDTSAELISISGGNVFTVFLAAYSNDFLANYTVFGDASFYVTFGTYKPGGVRGASGEYVGNGSVRHPPGFNAYARPLPAEETDFERFAPIFRQFALDAR